MRKQPLDLRRSLQILRRRLGTLAIAIVLGLIGGAGYTALNLPKHGAVTFVVLPATTSAPTTQVQILIADSKPVLTEALRSIKPAMSLSTLRSRIQIGNLTTDVISITASGDTVAQADRVANAVAEAYIAYVGSPSTPSGQLQAQILDYATDATSTRLLVRFASYEILGALLGALIGVLVVLAIGRGDRRLRQRDGIADAIGVPVLASIAVRHPRDAAGWTRVLETYEPSAPDAFRMHGALRDLGLARIMSAGAAVSSSLTVLSLSSDPGALAVGPQLAAFVASLGLPSVLVIDPQEETKGTVTLRAATAAVPSPEGSADPQVLPAEGGRPDQRPDGRLTVVVTVVDSRTPHVGHPMRTDALVLAVSAGGATADQLARVAASAANDGRSIDGILIADPDPADPTTGRLPQLARPTQRQTPSRLTGALR
jgi:capsular polysaccharide biosynthesis protein